MNRFCHISFCVAFALLCGTSLKGQSVQDTIYTRMGVPIPAIVLDMHQDNVRYRKEGSPDGAIQHIYRCNIQSIRRRNGTVHHFEPCAVNLQPVGVAILPFSDATVVTPPVGTANVGSLLPAASPIQYFGQVDGFYLNNAPISPTFVREMMRRDNPRAFETFNAAKRADNRALGLAVLSGVSLVAWGSVLLFGAFSEDEGSEATLKRSGSAKGTFLGITVASGGLALVSSMEARKRYASAVAFYNERFPFQGLSAAHRPSLHFGFCANGLGGTLQF